MTLESNCFSDVLNCESTPVEIVAHRIIQFLKETNRQFGRNAGASKQKMGDREFLQAIIGKPRIEEAGRKLMEAFGWLERYGLIAEEPYAIHQTMHVYQLTPLGEGVSSQSDIEEFKHRISCRREILHTSVADKCWSTFLSGDYSSSIFAAFKEVEVAVRKAGTFTNADIGVELMKKAFRPGGKLTDSTEPGGEQNALAALFEGAIGRFRNPSAHRHMEINSPEEAYEMLAFASHLMRVVTDRIQKDAQDGAPNDPLPA